MFPVRVEFNTLDEFIGELTLDCDRVVDRVVRVRIDATPQQVDAVTFEYSLWATAHVHGDQTDYIMELGINCGEHEGGEENADDARNRIMSSCDDMGLTVRNGKIEIL